MSGAVLYISYDGMLEPLGQSQVLAYLEHLAIGRPIHLISFEKQADRRDGKRMAAMRARMAAAGIGWMPLPYHKTPSAPATAFDVAIGIVVALWLVVRHRVGIVHARSYVAALMAVMVKRLTGVKFLFDMRGFWADERVDGGLWPKDGRLYRLAKALERDFLMRADAVVSLTQAAADEIAGFPYLAGRVPPIVVIPTCADLRRFSVKVGAAGPSGAFVLGYVGGAGTWYLFDESLAFFKALRERAAEARLLVVNRGEHDFILERLRLAGIGEDCYDLVSAEHAQMPDLVRRMDAGVVLIRPAYSKIASAPTKLAEFLGCGVPCVGNRGVGDMASLIAGAGVGVVMEGFGPDDHRRAAEGLLALARTPGIAQVCADAAARHFSLDEGVARYTALYARLDASGSAKEISA